MTAGETLRLMVEISGARTLERVVQPWFFDVSASRTAVAVKVGDADAGVADNVFSLSYDLVFQAAGSFALGSFEITADGRTLETDPIVVQVNPRDDAEVTVEVSVAPERIRVGGRLQAGGRGVRLCFRSVPVRSAGCLRLRRPVSRIRQRYHAEVESASGRGRRVRHSAGAGYRSRRHLRKRAADRGDRAAGRRGSSHSRCWVDLGRGASSFSKSRVSGAAEMDEEPVLPETGEFAELIALERSRSNMLGRAAREYRFRAVQAGRFEIGPVQVTAGGRTLATDPISITVDEVPTLETDPPGSLVYLGLPDKARAYVNEQVVVTYSLAYGRPATGFGPPARHQILAFVRWLPRVGTTTLGWFRGSESGRTFPGAGHGQAGDTVAW